MFPRHVFSVKGVREFAHIDERNYNPSRISYCLNNPWVKKNKTNMSPALFEANLPFEPTFCRLSKHWNIRAGTVCPWLVIAFVITSSTQQGNYTIVHFGKYK